MSVLSDAALAKYTSASPKGWDSLKTEIDIPAGLDLDGINFSQRQYVTGTPQLKR